MTNTYYEEPRPVRRIPTREQIEAARRQALLEARGTQSPSHHHIGSSSGFHPEEDEEVYDDQWPSRLPTSTRRYDNIPQMHPTVGKNVKVVEYYHDQPLIQRASRNQVHLPRQRERQIYTDEVETQGPRGRRHKRSIHPLLYLGVGMLFMFALFLLLSSARTWIQQKEDDLTYGRPRTFQIDFAVGHNDSPTNPSHFIAINLYRHVEVIEWPGQDSSKMKVYQITTLFGDGEDLTPVTLSFRDLTGNGKLDMLIHIQGQTIVMINENGTFRPAKAGEVKGLL